MIPDTVSEFLRTPVDIGAVLIGGVIVSVFVALYRWWTKTDFQDDRNNGFNERIHQQRKRISTYPSYPNGWYKVACVWEMKPGEIISRSVCGKDIVVYKPQEKVKGEMKDTAYVIDAYCPHLGANLGDGTVCGDCVECPFHGWQFNGEGKCTSIPYSSAPPPKDSNLPHWHSRVLMGIVVVWYDVDGLDPAYEPELIPELLDKTKYKYLGHKSERLAKHVQEIVENGADYAHFPKVHSSMVSVPWYGTVVGLEHNVQWEPLPKKHQSIVHNHAIATIFGKQIDNSKAYATIKFDGPGGIIHFHFKTHFGDIHFIQCSTPIAPMLVEFSMTMFAEVKVPWLMAKYFLKAWGGQAKMDKLIWENKVWRNKPLLVKGDGPMMQLRRWYSQFYSESSSYAGAHRAVDLEW